MHGLRLRAAFAAVAAALACTAGAWAQGGAEFLAGARSGVVTDERLAEISGIAASRASPGILWVHNDSGDLPRLYAVTAAGDLRGVFDVAGATAIDWEDIAVGPGPAAGQEYLYVGDIGDNAGRRAAVSVYRVPEPAVPPAGGPWEAILDGAQRITLRYPDGPRDAETLLVDPLNGDVYIVSKRDARSRVYRAAFPQDTARATTMELVAELPWGLATGGDISPDGSQVIVRGYANASLWARAPGATMAQAFAGREVTVPLAFEPQGEAICFDAEGAGYYTVSEGEQPALWYIARKRGRD